MGELPHVPMETVHIWLGVFASEDALDSYFDERMHDDDETPMNDFAADQGKVFYDHDWVERSFGEGGDLRSLIAGHSYSESYLENVVEEAKGKRITRANTFIMADIREFPSPRSADGKDYRLWYLGDFPCRG
ncbi:MAG: immunity 22 family protein [Holophagales bacterium]|nr:immunity 22 family protein [Holophagales bacterium]